MTSRLTRDDLLNRIGVILTEAEKIGYTFQIVDHIDYRLELKKNDHRISFCDFPPLDDPQTHKRLDNKALTTQILMKHGIPTGNGSSHICLLSALFKAKKIGFPLVIKPTFGSLSNGAFFPIRSWKQFVCSYYKSKRFGLHTMIESYIPGQNYRITMVNGNIAGAALRLPAHVIGDGQRTIAALIKEKNSDSRRKPADIPNCTLHELVVDKHTRQILKNQHLTLQTVPQKGMRCLLDTIVQLARGGDAYDVTDQIHATNKALYSKTTQALGATVAGIDCIMADISKPWNEQPCAIIDVNSKPHIDIHHYPTEGPQRNVAAEIVQLLPRIPSGDYD